MKRYHVRWYDKDRALRSTDVVEVYDPDGDGSYYQLEKEVVSAIRDGAVRTTFLKRRKQMVFTTGSGAVAKLIRNKLGVQQGPFWARIGVTQSGGSRYEAGREMPKQVALVLTIAYGTERESSKAVKELRNGG